jgi:hypothetical protein
MVALNFSPAVFAAAVTAASMSAQCISIIAAQAGETCSLLAAVREQSFSQYSQKEK